MSQTAIPYLFMRGGTSRGPYFNRAHLPQDRDTLAKVLISILGSGHALNIDGIGGGNPVTTKVAMLSKSQETWADIDYFFAQVSVADGLVDFKPTCGNILSGVGAAAVELGLTDASDGQTELMINAVNVGAKVRSIFPTPNGQVIYSGDQSISGVPGAAAPVELSFMDIAGSFTGSFLPTGNPRDTIDGIEVTCMDAAMPMVLARAQDMGLTGEESREELNENKDFFDRMEPIRLRAAELMGMGDCSKSVTPKFGVLAPSDKPDHIITRYFMPWMAHPTMAVTGGQCMAACALTAGSVADGMLKKSHDNSPITITLEHASGTMDVIMDYSTNDGVFTLNSAGLLRTCRKLADGHVYVPSEIWSPS